MYQHLHRRPWQVESRRRQRPLDWGIRVNAIVGMRQSILITEHDDNVKLGGSGIESQIDVEAHTALWSIISASTDGCYENYAVQLAWTDHEVAERIS